MVHIMYTGISSIFATDHKESTCKKKQASGEIATLKTLSAELYHHSHKQDLRSDHLEQTDITDDQAPPEAVPALEDNLQDARVVAASPQQVLKHCLLGSP